MRLNVFILTLCLFIVPGCDKKDKGSNTPKETTAVTMAWPKDWTAHLGKTVTVEGTAFNSKGGAYLNGKINSIWIDGLNSWPEGYYTGGDTGKKVRVAGVVIKRDDVPVFVFKPDEEALAGVPVATKEEAEIAKWRFLLKDAKWELAK